MAIEYCNIGSDLTDAYIDISIYNKRRDLFGWELHTGTVWKIEGSGYVELVYQDGTKLSDNGAIPDATGEYWYEDTTDTLYVRLSDDKAPEQHILQGGVDWKTFLTRCRNDAQEIAESYLRNHYFVPFSKIIKETTVSYNTRAYDFWLVRLVALITCWLVIKRLNPGSKVADQLYREFDNQKRNPSINENLGLVQRIQQGEIVLSIQRSAREPGGFNLAYKDPHTAGAFYEITGSYVGSDEQVWRVELDTSGIAGTATYKIRRHPSGDWEETLKDTKIGDSQRVALGYGIYIRFIGTFTIGDYVDIHLFPANDKIQAQSGGSKKTRFN